MSVVQSASLFNGFSRKNSRAGQSGQLLLNSHHGIAPLCLEILTAIGFLHVGMPAPFEALYGADGASYLRSFLWKM